METRLVFNFKKWNGRDKGDNSQFWEECEILEVSTSRDGDEIATVKFPDGTISKGHFTHYMDHFKEFKKEHEGV